MNTQYNRFGTLPLITDTLTGSPKAIPARHRFDLVRSSVGLLAALSISACASHNIAPETVPTLVPTAAVSADTSVTPTADTNDAIDPLLASTPADSTRLDDIRLDTVAQQSSDNETPARLDPVSVITWRAERGHSASQLQLGRAYATGDRVEKDLEAARLWLELAAMQSNNEAQYELGTLYFTGNGVRRDYFNAREWWLEAAVNGNSDAQQKLGYLYSEGLGVERDFKRAKTWYVKAASLGHAEAQTLLGSLHHEGDRLPTDYEEAIKWYTMAARQGHAHAQYTLATLYHDGLGATTDYVQCAAWADVAVANGYPDELKAGSICRSKLDEAQQSQATELGNSYMRSQSF